MLCGLVPDLVRHGIGAIAEPGDGLGQRERGAFAVGEIRRVAPCRRREQALVGFAGLFGKARMPVNTDAATVDLARAEVNKFQQPFFQPAVFGLTLPRLAKPPWRREPPSLGCSFVLA
jgi:hypothetical protein